MCRGEKLAERQKIRPDRSPSGDCLLRTRTDVDGAPEIDPVEPIRRDTGFGTLAPIDSDRSVASLGVGARNRSPHAMADDDAIRSAATEELRQLRGQGGDGHHRRAVRRARRRLEGSRAAPSQSSVPCSASRGKEGFMRDRVRRRPPAHRAQTPRRPAGFREWGRCGSVRPRTNPATEALLPIPNAIVSSNVSVRPGIRVRLLTEYRRSLHDGIYAGRDARPVPLVNSRSRNPYAGLSGPAS